MLLSNILNGNWVTTGFTGMEENLRLFECRDWKISLSLLWIYEKIVTCKRDPEARDETETFDFQSETETFPHFSETETLGKCVSRPSRDRDVETETSRPRLHGLQPVRFAQSKNGGTILIVLPKSSNVEPTFLKIHSLTCSAVNLR